MRIERHPILDIPENREKVTIYVNGEPIEAVKGEVVAAALLAAGYKTFRKTPKYHRPRGIFCAIGRCSGRAVSCLNRYISFLDLPDMAQVCVESILEVNCWQIVKRLA